MFNDNEYKILIQVSKGYCLKAIAQFDKMAKRIEQNIKKYEKWVKESDKE